MKTTIFSILRAATLGMILLGGLCLTAGVQKSGAKETAQAQSASQKTSQTININSADAETLTRLPGVGPVIAQRIVDYRAENGAFKQPQDLIKVKGIGPKTYEKLAAMISI